MPHYADPHPDEGTSCFGGFGWMPRGHIVPGCDGELVTHQAKRTDFGVSFTLTVHQGHQQAKCSFGVKLAEGAEYRVDTTPERMLAIYARTDEELLGWEFDLDCELQRETALPARPLQPIEPLLDY